MKKEGKGLGTELMYASMGVSNISLVIISGHFAIYSDTCEQERKTLFRIGDRLQLGLYV